MSDGPKNSSVDLPGVDAGEIARLMEEVSGFGGSSNGAMHRLTLSEQDKAARDWLVRWMREQGLKVAIDPIGNVFGTLEWAGAGAPAVMTGSHLDSQPNGGRFDGAYGVVASCAALSTLQRHAAAAGIKPRHNITVVNWTNEEGARFQPSLLGSGVYTGQLSLDYALARKDGDGVTVADALAEIGYAGKDAAPPVPTVYVEIHIEGAPKLEQTGRRFGAFTRFWGAVKYRLAFIGRQAHTGPTPMADRHDAVLAAAYVIADIKSLTEEAGVELHGSVGRLEVSPNSPNVVAGEVVMFIELRSVRPDVLEWAEAQLKLRIDEAAERARVTHEVRSIDRRPAGVMDAGLIALAGRTARRLGHEMLPLDTIAGHDGVSMTAVCPSVVLAVPSKGGVIHHPDEWTSEEDRALGTQILAAMLWQICTRSA